MGLRDAFKEENVIAVAGTSFEYTFIERGTAKTRMSTVYGRHADSTMFSYYISINYKWRLCTFEVVVDTYTFCIIKAYQVTTEYIVSKEDLGGKSVPMERRDLFLSSSKIGD